ncbi:MAG: MFS transporter [Candidatus Eremiobacteraeota bacterium]|nr:MFS transporter [Candidatus Eremiobacteraeota bacterium]
MESGHHDRAFIARRRDADVPLHAAEVDLAEGPPLPCGSLWRCAAGDTTTAANDGAYQPESILERVTSATGIGAAAAQPLTRAQRNTFLATFLGWTLDAFDFFLVTFVVVQLAKDFKHTIPQVAFAITVTLMLRPLGAFIFGYFADKYGRRVPLMVDIAFYSLIELLTAFSPNFTVFIILRALYGIGMGGEWGVGSALAMENLPPERRGFFSGVLQEGYALGFLLAGGVFFAMSHFFPQHTWRAMFVVGVLPALLVLFIRAHVPESPAWIAQRAMKRIAGPTPVQGYAIGLLVAGALFYLVLAFAPAYTWLALIIALAIVAFSIVLFTKSGEGPKSWPLFLYAVLLMASFNFMSHGTQDLYPTFLQKQHGFDSGKVFLINSIANIGAIIGGMLFGALSQRVGRRVAITVAAVLGVCMIPIWAFSPTLVLLALGGFLMQFMVQGAWGIIPAHLNELSPADARGTFPGFVYQFGNFLSAGAAQIEAQFATTRFKLPNGGANYAHAMATIAVIVFVAVIFFTLIGKEARNVAFAPASP